MRAVTTASIANTPAEPSHTNVSSWSESTQVSPANAPVAGPVPAPTRTAAAPIAPQPEKLQAPPSGKYSLQVGAVRSRPEADLLVARLLTGHGGQLGARDPQVDEAVIGSMGTFFRVTVGPFADASEPSQLCATLQPDGFDCLVVTK